MTNIDGDGRDELYVSLEARTESVGGKQRQKEPLEILAYRRRREGKPERTPIAVLEKGVQARVLLAGDIEGKGSRDIVVTTMRDGIWRLVPRDGTWGAQQIDAESSGFEHAVGLADLDDDGRLDLYVAADDQDEVRCYRYEKGKLQRRVIHTLGRSDLTWSIEVCC